MDLYRIWNFFRRYPLELEDNSWFPSRWRTFMTDYLRAMFDKLHLYDPVVPLIANALGDDPHVHILDLCSGSGGPILRIRSLVEDVLRRNIVLTLSDKYVEADPAELRTAGFTFLPLDATNVPRDLHGFRTLFTSFHHFPNDAARHILINAIEQGNGIGVFDITNRRPLNFLLVLLTPVNVLLLTPFLKPFSMYRLLLTYVLPVIPLAATWDGIISNLRSYSLDELRALANECGSCQWKSGILPSRLGTRITYLIGEGLKQRLEQKDRAD